jgi:hypothetical protein
MGRLAVIRMPVRERVWGSCGAAIEWSGVQGGGAATVMRPDLVNPACRLGTLTRLLGGVGVPEVRLELLDVVELLLGVFGGDRGGHDHSVAGLPVVRIDDENLTHGRGVTRPWVDHVVLPGHAMVGGGVAQMQTHDASSS